MDIDGLLRATMEAQGSDLHLTAGVQPMIRLWGHIEPLAEYDVLSPEDTVQLAYGMLNAFQKQKFDETWELDLAYKRPKLTVKSNDPNYSRKAKEIQRYKRIAPALAKRG